MKTWQSRILIIPLVLSLMSCLLMRTKAPVQQARASTPRPTNTSIPQPTRTRKTNVSSPTNTPVSQVTKTKTKSIPPSPTNTKIPTVIIPGSDAPIVEYDYGSASHTTPEDVFDEALYGGFGGGGDGDDCRICTDSDLPYITCKEERLEWGEHTCILSCGWKQNEKVSLRVYYPDGRDEIIDKQTMEHRQGCVYFHVGISDPLGNYLISLEGESDTVQQEIEVYLPNEPRVYHDDDKLLLLNFQPHEHVKVLNYEWNPKRDFIELVSWYSYQVDQYGQLVVLKDRTYMTVVIGERSGQVDFLNQTAMPTLTKNVCPGLPLTQFQMGYACVSVPVGKELIYTESAEQPLEALGGIPNGTKVNIISDPVCLDRGIKWHVKFYGANNEQIKGWVYEVFDGTYYLSPCDDDPD